MADTVKSALFVDYDSIHRRLKNTSGNAAGELAERIGAFITAIKSGRLVSPKVAGMRRRILIRRAYADPGLLGQGRAAFTGSGFEVVDCPLQEGRARNSADIHIVLDTVDALEHPTGYDEFILLSADTDLTPLLLRLRAHNRTTVIYANGVTAGAYKALADGTVDEAPLIALLDGDDEEADVSTVPASATTRVQAAAASAGPPADRGTLEAVARKIHAATNVPMFSPRTYADLFRTIAQEIAERGYHFQDTADNVTATLTAAGRNVNRRQVLFVVKGLALKGHVFSTTDSPEKLAEVFREQVFYLIGNSDLTLDESEQALLRSWIVGRVAASTPNVPEPVAGKVEPDTRGQRRRAAKPAPPAAKQPPPREPARPPQREPQPVQAREAPRREPPKEPVREPVSEPEEAAAPPTPPPQPSRSVLPRRLDEIRAAAAARLAAIGRPSPGQPPKAAAKPMPAAKVPPPKPAAPKSPPPKQDGGGTRKDPIESSILAAIAEAVDVLVEDGGNTGDDADRQQAPPAPSSPQKPQPAAAAERPADPQPSEGGDSDDIGDEIQRIIASYSRARQGEGQ